MLDIISDAEVVEIVYEFLKTSITIIDLSKFDPTDGRYIEFTDTLTKVKGEINKNKNKSDIRMVNLDVALQTLFSRMDIKSLDDLSELSEELKKILENAIAINAENDRLANIYDGNFALVKTYQDALVLKPELSNKDIEEAIKYIYSQIKEGIDTNILVVQGREGFIDATKKKVVTGLLTNGLYKKLALKNWLQNLLNVLYGNLQNFR